MLSDFLRITPDINDRDTHENNKAEDPVTQAGKQRNLRYFLRDADRERIDRRRRKANRDRDIDDRTADDGVKAQRNRN